MYTHGCVGMTCVLARFAYVADMHALSSCIHVGVCSLCLFVYNTCTLCATARTVLVVLVMRMADRIVYVYITRYFIVSSWLPVASDQLYGRLYDRFFV